MGRARGERGWQWHPRLLPQTWAVVEPLMPVPSSLQAVSLQLTAVPSLCPHSKPQVPAPSLHPHQHTRISGWEAQGCDTDCPAWLLRSPLPQLISPSGRWVPQAQEPLLQLPHRGAGPFPFPLCFLLSFLVAWGVSYPLTSLWSPASVQGRTVPFPTYLCRGEFHVLLL